MSGLSGHNRRENEVANAVSAPETNAKKEVDAWIGRLNQKVRDIVVNAGCNERVFLEKREVNDIGVEVRNDTRSVLISFTVNGLNQDVVMGIWALLSSNDDSITVCTTHLERGVTRTAVFQQKDLKTNNEYKLSFQSKKPVDVREG